MAVQEVSCSLNFDSHTGRGKLSLANPRYSGLRGDNLSGGFRWERDVVRLEKLVLQQQRSRCGIRPACRALDCFHAGSPLCSPLRCHLLLLLPGSRPHFPAHHLPCMQIRGARRVHHPAQHPTPQLSRRSGAAGPANQVCGGSAPRWPMAPPGGRSIRGAARDHPCRPPAAKCHIAVSRGV